MSLTIDLNLYNVGIPKDTCLTLVNCLWIPIMFSLSFKWHFQQYESFHLLLRICLLTPLSLINWCFFISKMLKNTVLVVHYTIKLVQYCVGMFILWRKAIEAPDVLSFSKFWRKQKKSISRGHSIPHCISVKCTVIQDTIITYKTKDETENERVVWKNGNTT